MTIIHVDASGAAGAEKTIPAALAKAESGDLLIVHDGIYTGAVYVNKPVVIQAADGETPIIDGGYGPHKRKADGWLPPPTVAAYTPLVKVTAAGAILDGLTIRNSGGRGLQIMASSVNVIGCKVDFAYNGVLWIGGASKSAKIKDVLIVGSTFTRGSMKAFDPTRGYGGTPMGIDGCALIMHAVNTQIRDSAFAYGAGEGLTPYRGAEGTLVDNCLMHSHLHDNLYVNAGGAGLTVRNCVAYDAVNAAPQLEESGLNCYGNVTLADEEPDWISGPGLAIYDCIFAPSWSGRVFEIAGWNGTGNFPRPFALRGYLGYSTMAAGPRNNGTLFGSSPHLAHSGLVENLIITGGVTAHNFGKGWSGVVVRNILSDAAFPAALGVGGGKVAAATLHNPKEVNALGFDLWSAELPDPYATDFDPANYAPRPDSPAWGMAATGAANGITPPVTRPDVGAALDGVTPPPEPEPEPPAWVAPLAEMSARLQALEEAKFAVYGALDALDNELADTGAAFVELANALSGEGGDPGAE